MEREWLDVPFDDKDYAKECGARWNWAEKRWYAPEPNMPALERWRAQPPIPSVLVGEDRNFGSGLFVDLVPQTAWFTNVRSCVSGLDWDRIRRMVTSRAGNCCEICGGERDAKDKIRMEAHERWEYDDADRVQILRRLICLCTRCHTATHMGLARIQGHEDEAIEHLMRINQWNETQAEAHVRKAFDTWERRSQKEWSLDVSMIEGIGVLLAKQPDASERKTYADTRAREVTTEVDVVDPSSRQTLESAHRQNEATVESAKKYEVGFRIGAQLRKSGGGRYHSSLPSGGSRKTVIPHMRRAHWHHYWIGPKYDPRPTHTGDALGSPDTCGWQEDNAGAPSSGGRYIGRIRTTNQNIADRGQAAYDTH